MEPWLKRAAAAHPEREALVSQNGSITYAELHERAVGAAGALADRGVIRGDRVALALAPGEDFVVALHGCLLGGAAAVPVDVRLTADEQEVRAAGATNVVDRPLERGAGARPAPMELDQIAAVVHTSGTAAAPRPIGLTYRNWQASAMGSALALGLDEQERWLCAMPLAHVGGLSIPIRSAIYGTTVVMHERFDVAAVARALSAADQRITVVSLVPTMLTRLLDEGLKDPPTLRWALLGGGPIPPGLQARAEASGVPVAPTYGMTEACSQIATHGWPLWGVEVALSRGAEPREILVRGPIVAPGALGDDGWLHTGDLGTLDDDGRLRITGRKADTIVSGAENVAPAEVEAVLLDHPAVADAAVHARPDQQWGEAVVATVVLLDGATPSADELRAHCAERLATFKVPKAIAFARALPRTASGKLLRREL
jgi:O-succinylbenzoic acid--CoA ligase